MGHIHAVAGIAQGTVDVGAQAPNHRYPIDHDTDIAAPLVINARRTQLREDFVHARFDTTPDARRYPARIVTATAEQQATVRGQPKIIQHVIGVAKGHVQRVDLPGQVFRQRLGRDNETAGRKHLPRQAPGLQLLVGIARQHHAGRFHTPV